MIRTDAQLSVSRFAELIGVPRRTYTWRLARHRADDPVGVWPAPVVDRIEPTVAKYAEEWPAWGHRKIWALARADGHDVGPRRRWRGRCAAGACCSRCVTRPNAASSPRPAGRCSWTHPPGGTGCGSSTSPSSRPWAAGSGGSVALSTTPPRPPWPAPSPPPQTAADMIAALDAAQAAAEILLGCPLILDCVDDQDRLWPVVVVTDNGPAMKSAAVAAWFAQRPHFAHVRTRHRSPGTNGVIERWFQALKYERLYRHDIADGLGLEDHVEAFRYEFNHIRPHEALDWARPIEAYLPSNPTRPGPEQQG